LKGLNETVFDCIILPHLKNTLTSLFHYFDNFQISSFMFWEGPPDKLAEFFYFM